MEAKLAYDFLVGGNNCDLDDIFNKIQKLFEVGMVNNGPVFVLSGTEVKIGSNDDMFLSIAK